MRRCGGNRNGSDRHTDAGGELSEVDREEGEGMILLIIALATLIAGIIWNVKDEYSTGAMAVCVLAGITSFVLIIMAIASNVNAEGRFQADLQKREALVYQLENQTYLNDNNLGTVELFEEIAEFNGLIYKHRAGRKNPFINLYFVPYADKIEPIDITGR